MTPNSKRIRNLILKPMKPAQIPKIKYKVPMSLWFVDVSQRRKEGEEEEGKSRKKKGGGGREKRKDKHRNKKC